MLHQLCGYTDNKSLFVIQLFLNVQREDLKETQSTRTNTQEAAYIFLYIVSIFQHTTIQAEQRFVLREDGHK